MTIDPIENISGVELGILGTHLGFLEALVPDSEGRIPRNADGEFKVLAGAREILERSPVKVDAMQISAFRDTLPSDSDEVLSGVRALGLEPQIVMMVGGANPVNPADEDETVNQLLNSIAAAKRNQVKEVNSTSIETWMEGEPPKDEAEFQARVEQAIKVHLRIYEEAGLADSCIDHWNIEFLRPGEFQNFTSLAKLRPIITGLNSAVGRPFFRVLVDAAHCGDSGLTMAENEVQISELAAAGELGSFHCSVPTTRGCLTSDDGWIPALLGACARTGKLHSAFVELFRHDDPAMEPLRKLDPRHGVDTTGGLSYTDVMINGLVQTVRRLNNYKARGII